MPAVDTRLSDLIIGRSYHQSTRWTGGALLLAGGWLLLSTVQDTLGTTVNTPLEPVGTVAFVSAVVGTLVLPVVHAYRNEGWVVCCVFGAVPGLVLGWTGTLVVGGELTLAQRFVQSVLAGVATGLTIGTVSFLVGMGIASWRTSP